MRLGEVIAVGVCGVALSAVLVAPVVFDSGCRQEPSPGVPRANSVVVAEVAGAAIHAADVAAEMRRRRIDARQALEVLVGFELLARAAADAGSAAPDDADAEALQAARVERLIEREIEPRITKEAITDAEVRALYERVKARFVHGRLVQVAVLCVFTGSRMKPEPRARAEANARALRAVVDRRPSMTLEEFQAIAKEPAWIERKVSFTTVWQGEDTPFPAVVGRAAVALSKAGDTTDLVGDETGYYIARYVSERPPENVSFADAAAHLREEMYEPWRRQRFLQLSMEMSNGHDIQVFPENLPLLAAGAAAPPLPSPSRP